MNNNGILSDEFVKLVVYDKSKEKEIAVITKEMVTTAKDDIVIKLTPKY